MFSWFIVKVLDKDAHTFSVVYPGDSALVPVKPAEIVPFSNCDFSTHRGTVIGTARHLGEVCSAVGDELLGSFHTEIFFRRGGTGI